MENSFVVKSLTKTNNLEFLEYMDQQFKDPRCLRNDWFDRSFDWCLQNRYTRYLYWSIVYIDNKIVAFSAIQDYEFKKNTARVCSRMYYDPSIRFSYNKKTYKDIITPVTPMIIDQFNYLKDKDYKYAIATIESHRSVDTLNIIANNINYKTGLTNFKVMPTKIQTYKGQAAEDFQHYMEHKF